MNKIKKNMNRLILILIFIMSTTSYTQWIIPDSSHAFQTTLCTNGTDLYAAGIYNDIFKSTNHGNNWTQVYQSDYPYSVIMNHQGNIYIATHLGIAGMRKSNDNGATWIPINILIDSLGVFTMAGANGHIFAGAGNDFYRSPDAGYTWMKMSLHKPLSIIYVTGVHDSTLLCVSNDRLYRTTNEGYNWDTLSIGVSIHSLTSIGTTLYAGASSGGYNGVWKSTNNGLNWIHTGGTSLPNLYFYSIISVGNNLIAGTGGVNQSGSGVYVSTNGGDNWSMSTPNTYLNGNCITIESSYIYFVDNSLFRNTLSQVIAVNQISIIVPKEFLLGQNYPNPFNPVTTIRFHIPKPTFVKVAVYDVIGREVEILGNEIVKAGQYKVTWDASKYSSGIYFYKLITNDYSVTKKMILLK